MKDRIKILVSAICLFISAYGIAQNRSSAAPVPATTDPAERVRLIVRDVLEAGGYPTLEIRLREDRVIRNAMATLEGRDRYIKYNPDFVVQFERNAQTQYAAYALFAHEIGHHALNHDFAERDCGKRKKMELEADAFAGRVMNMLCISLDDATAGFRSMDQDISTGCYPPPSVRETAVSNGWIERNDYFLNRGQQHPCETQVPFPLRLGDRQPFNRSQNVQGVIKGNRMIITYDLPKDMPAFRVFFGVENTAPLTPRSLDWIGDSTLPGPGRTLIWNFTDDGYTRAQVEKKTEWLGIVAYAPQFVPKPYPAGLRVLHISGITAGAGLLGYGILLKLDACDLYDTYQNNRDPDAELYTKGKLSRDEMFKKANRENKWALVGMTAGTVATGLLTWRLIKRSLSNKRFQAAHFYTAAPWQPQLESLSMTDGGGRPGFGLQIRF